MTNANTRGLGAKVVPVAIAAALTICGALAVFAQGTLPLPTPGTPAAPVTPQGEQARARAAALAAKANVDIAEAWTKASGDASSAPIYLRIVSVKDPDKLIGVEVATAQRIELRDDSPGAASRVMPDPALDIPGGATVNLAAGGRYFQLVGLKAPLKEGDSFLLTMKFDKAGTSSTAVKILGANATSLPPISSARRGDTTAGVSQR